VIVQNTAPVTVQSALQILTYHRRRYAGLSKDLVTRPSIAMESTPPARATLSCRLHLNAERNKVHAMRLCTALAYMLLAPQNLSLLLVMFADLPQGRAIGNLLVLVLRRSVLQIFS